MRKVLLILVFMIAGANLFSQSEKLQHYKFVQIDSLFQSEERPIAVFIHTNWCDYCQNMKNTTFKNEQVIKALNTGYYYISFNAETEELIPFRGHNFTFQTRGRKVGTHELAQALGAINGKLSFPTFVVLNRAFEIIFQHDSYLSGRELSVILNNLE